MSFQSPHARAQHQPVTLTGEIITHELEATLVQRESLRRKWEKCATSPRAHRSLLLSSVAQPTAAPACHSPGARGPQRRRADTTRPHANSQLCQDYSVQCNLPRIQLVRWKSSHSTLRRCATRDLALSCRKRRNRKWRKRRETAALSSAHRHPGLLQRGPLIYRCPSVRSDPTSSAYLLSNLST